MNQHTKSGMSGVIPPADKIKVTVEFPSQSDRSAEREFIARLKEIYMRKIPPLSYLTTNKGERPDE